MRLQYIELSPEISRELCVSCRGFFSMFRLLNFKGADDGMTELSTIWQPFRQRVHTAQKAMDI